MDKIKLTNRFAVVAEQLQRLLDRRVAGFSASSIQIETLKAEMNRIIKKINS